ncbi:MAG TPA: MXAN_5187 C-terminal domain-containing protein [Candidatus Acidoferrales bacterium]|nr:MXAN_5187 C-terminal domain-containing protein [Candidatus Acidoferrales bacterium]
MATIDEELGQIERDVRTLKIEYEQFFGGGRKRPPADTQWRVESLIRRYNERVGELSYGQRFRFNNLAQTYAKYQEMWRKKLVQKESGAQQRHFGAAAKAIEAERARKTADNQVPITSEDSSHTSNSGAAGSRDVIEQRRAIFALSLSNPEHEKEKIYALYEKLIEARTQTGQKSGTPSLKDFENFVREKTKDLKHQGGRDVEYSVNIENGRVKLKARVAG